MKKILTLGLFLSAMATLFACSDNPESNSAKPLQNPGDTPTEAYIRLFTAVKRKNTEAIKQEVSEKTKALAESLASRQKSPVEKVYENGFTATTFSEQMPEIREERVKDMMGAIEVWNSRDKRWEDLPFIREETGWKLAIGDVFANTYKSPGKGRDQLEREAANVMSSNKAPIVSQNTNTNTKPVTVRNANFPNTVTNGAVNK